MVQSVFSPLWYRVADLSPRLRGHAVLHRHTYRGELWYVLQDSANARNHRFTPSAYFLIGQMDGSSTLQQIWERAVMDLGEEAPTQEEVIQLLGQLHASDVLTSDSLPDTGEIFDRHQKQSAKKVQQKFLSPLSIKIPLFDPERFLAKTSRYVNPIFGIFGAIIWMLVVAWALVQAGLHWNELTQNITDTVLTPGNLVLLWLLFPIVKGLHEFGHAYAANKWGGEVHEMGIMLLVFMPVPYVDASAASAFRERYQRVVVGAAGMLVELFLAAIALWVWLLVEPGLVRTMAYNIVLISSVSTILFNANPLLRFDGYYIFSDAIEVPNLGGRANQYLFYLIQRYLFGLREAVSPVTARGERLWFFVYSISSFCYRTVVMLAITMLVASKFFFFGVLIAALAVSNMFLMPIIKGLKFLLGSAKLQRKRWRAVSVTLFVVGGLTLFIVFKPVPYWSNAEGVVWLPEQSVIRASSDCFVQSLLISPGEKVVEGSELLVCSDMSLSAEAVVLKAKLAEVKVRYFEQLGQNPLAAEVTKDQLETVQADYDRANELVAALVIKSPASGRFTVPLAQDLEGQYLRKGEVVGYVLQQDTTRIRTVVSQQQVSLLRHRVDAVELLYSFNTSNPQQATILREVPSASNQLPSPALGSNGGGKIPVDPRYDDGMKTLEPVFQFDLELPEVLDNSLFGNRVYIRFRHGNETLANQWYRRIRQLFLGEFGV